jgi:Cu-Zn family superoxide dismutase
MGMGRTTQEVRMRTPRLMVATLAALALLAAGSATASARTRADAPPPPTVTLAAGELLDPAGQSVGLAVVIDDGTVAAWSVFGFGLAPGLHGLQLHAAGDCAPPFDGVGARLDSTDLATMSVDDAGEANTAFLTPSNDLAGFADTDGFSLVVHDAPDNRANIPPRYQSTDSSDPGPDEQTLATGDVGGGIACAEMDATSDLSVGQAHRERTRFTRTATAHLATPLAAASRRAGRAPAPVDMVQADLFDTTGARRGRIRLVTDADSVSGMSAQIPGLEAGAHGVQVHTGGSCTGTDFGDAGPKLAGADLPDITSSGPAFGALFGSFATLPSLSGLLQGDGSTVVVHTKADNHANVPDRYTADGAPSPGADATTQATGDAGLGILCGVVRTVPRTERYIDAVYEQLLERGVEPSALATWTSYLSRHSRSSFVSTVMASLEARRRFVANQYLMYLDAEPDASGLAYWTAQAARRSFDEAALGATLLSTKHFFDDWGGTNADYVDGVFSVVLLRDPSPAEGALLRGYLNHGGSRRAVAAQLLTSDEAHAGTIADEYFFATGRDVEFGELSLWMEYLRRGGRYRDLRVFLLGGDEFLEQAQTASLGGPFFFDL